MDKIIHSDKQDTINKSTLLNWLYSAPKEVEIEELGKWIESRTNGTYVLIKKDTHTEVKQYF